MIQVDPYTAISFQLKIPLYHSGSGQSVLIEGVSCTVACNLRELSMGRSNDVQYVCSQVSFLCDSWAKVTKTDTTRNTGLASKKCYKINWLFFETRWKDLGHPRATKTGESNHSESLWAVLQKTRLHGGKFMCKNSLCSQNHSLTIKILEYAWANREEQNPLTWSPGLSVHLDHQLTWSYCIIMLLSLDLNNWNRFFFH